MIFISGVHGVLSALRTATCVLASSLCKPWAYSSFHFHRSFFAQGAELGSKPSLVD